MRPNLNTVTVALTLVATSRVRIEEAKRMRHVDKRKALTMINEANEIAAQALRLIRR